MKTTIQALSEAMIDTEGTTVIAGKPGSWFVRSIRADCVQDYEFSRLLEQVAKALDPEHHHPTRFDLAPPPIVWVVLGPNKAGSTIPLAAYQDREAAMAHPGPIFAAVAFRVAMRTDGAELPDDLAELGELEARELEALEAAAEMLQAGRSNGDLADSLTNAATKLRRDLERAKTELLELSELLEAERKQRAVFERAATQLQQDKDAAEAYKLAAE